MCKYAGGGKFMRVKEGASPYGTCLLWTGECSKCQRPYRVGELYRVTKVKNVVKRASSIEFVRVELDKHHPLDVGRGCAQVVESVCLKCAPMTDEEKKSRAFVVRVFQSVDDLSPKTIGTFKTRHEAFQCAKAHFLELGLTWASVSNDTEPIDAEKWVEKLNEVNFEKSCPYIEVQEFASVVDAEKGKTKKAKRKKAV